MECREAQPNAEVDEDVRRKKKDRYSMTRDFIGMSRCKGKEATKKVFNGPERSDT